MKKLLPLAILALLGCEPVVSPTSYKNPNPRVQRVEHPAEYEIKPTKELYDLIAAHKGKIEIPLTTVSVGRQAVKSSVDERGEGYAWAKTMEGTLPNGTAVTLNTTHVGRAQSKSKWTARSYGFAWADRVRGEIAGTHFQLTCASKLQTTQDSKWTQRSYGFASCKVLEGKIGDSIFLKYISTQHTKEKTSSRWTEHAYGFAWTNLGTLTLHLAEGSQ